MKTKILYIISDRNFGGGSRHVFDLITNLDKKRFIPILISIPSPILDRLEGKIKTYQVEMNSRLDLKAVKKIQSIIEQEKPAIIHLHSTRAGILGTLAAKRYKLPIIYTEHLFTKEYIPHNKLIHIYQLNAFKYLSKHISKVIAVSNSVKNYLVDKKIFAPHQVEVIYHGVDTTKFNHLTNATHHQEIIVGSIGSLHRNKGFGKLIHAVQELRNIKLEIIGPGTDMSELKKIDSKGKVKFWDYQENPQKLMKNWDIYVQYSNFESFGLAIAEAMASGIATIATNIGGTPELVGDAGILISPGNEKSLQNAIMKLANDSKLRIKLGKKAEERIEKYFTIKNMVRKTEELYKKLL